MKAVMNDKYSIYQAHEFLSTNVFNEVGSVLGCSPADGGFKSSITQVSPCSSPSLALF